ncbi:MAG: GNAT family N-acetyltransferase [Mycobacteriales bacterium]
MSDLVLRLVTQDELRAVTEFVTRNFNQEPNDAETEYEMAVVELERWLLACDGDQMAGTAGAYTRQITVPGGSVPAAAVTWVTVAPTHRRRGVLTAMMRRQLTDVYERGVEAVAILWASESAIYGRFGYGLSSEGGLLTIRSRDVRLTLPPAPGRYEEVLPLDALPAIRDVFEANRRDRSGMLDRDEAWWKHRLTDLEHRRDGMSALRCVVHRDPAGTADGYALYRVKFSWGERGPDGEVSTLELMATSPPAYAAIWQYLLGLDLTRTLTVWHPEPDLPVRHLVNDAQQVRFSPGSGVWTRLVDVPKALAARAYLSPVDVVLEVGDDFCPWNAGRYRLSGDRTGARCERTGDPADLSLTSTELGAAYLGGTTLTALAAAGRVTEHTAGALAAASHAFTAARAPWTPEVF